MLGCSEMATNFVRPALTARSTPQGSPVGLSVVHLGWSKKAQCIERVDDAPGIAGRGTRSCLGMNESIAPEVPPLSWSRQKISCIFFPAQKDVGHSEYPGRDGRRKQASCGVMEKSPKLVSNVTQLVTSESADPQSERPHSNRIRLAPPV